MKNVHPATSAGFAIVELMVVVAVLAAVVGGGVLVARKHSAAPTNVQIRQADAGTDKAVSAVIDTEFTTEAAISSASDASTRTASTSDAAAMQDMGEAYDASNL